MVSFLGHKVSPVVEASHFVATSTHNLHMNVILLDNGFDRRYIKGSCSFWQECRDQRGNHNLDLSHSWQINDLTSHTLVMGALGEESLSCLDARAWLVEEGSGFLPRKRLASQIGANHNTDATSKFRCTSSIVEVGYCCKE